MSDDQKENGLLSARALKDQAKRI